MYRIIICILFHMYSILANNKNISNYLSNTELTEFHSGIQPIDCIYVINLDERYDRWQRTQAICKNHRLLVNRVSAINGWKLSKRSIRELTTPYHQITKGGIGCLLSHLSVLQHALDNEFDCVWIMEDDIAFLDNPHRIRHLIRDLSQIDPNWDIFYTDVRNYWDINGKYTHQSIKPDNYLSNTLVRVENRYGTHSMIISKGGVEKILSYFLGKPISIPIDVDLHLIPNIRKYSPSWHITSVVESSFSDTEISPEIEIIIQPNNIRKKRYKKKTSVQTLLHDSLQKNFPILKLSEPRSN